MVLHQLDKITGSLKIHGEHHGDYKDMFGLLNQAAQALAVSVVLP